MRYEIKCERCGGIVHLTDLEAGSWVSLVSDATYDTMLFTCPLCKQNTINRWAR